ncbi:MAG: hypothetical protein CM15mP98_08630 [Paracoccaceae bacterium]|nr:MAG: hypothetical protein CM15mP98_08630 [Paracoccaceae bacterium]
MFRIKQKNAPEGPCFTCRLIRSFIMATIMLIVLGLLATDKLHLLKFISTDYDSNDYSISWTTFIFI